MTEDQKHSKQIAERLADIYKIVHDETVQQILDKEKYSHWLVAFATAGFTVALLRSDSIASQSWLGVGYARTIFFCIGIIFLFSAVVGAVIKKKIADVLDYYRTDIVLMLKQSILFDPPDQKIDVDKLFNALQGAEFLDDEQKADVLSSRKKAPLLVDKIGLFLVLQEILVATGYIAILVCAIPS